MEGTEIQGHSFGQRRPPLTELIKSILVRYPDGGQILKELIQNADDAGATEVKFLYDSQSFGSNSLLSPELREFQGPALYCYNNATFKTEDWEGIQNLMRSNKKEDPLKVGRFGIGFNSVYHITDLPGIVSGETLGFLDPHECYFGRGESGKGFRIKDGLLRSGLKDQFMPFHGVFECDLLSTRPYPGTLFRFPLRKKPSKLSDKPYTTCMVENLFDSLREEASVILLFLKSVQSISIYERKNADSAQCVFKVEISPDTREEVQRERQELLRQANNPGHITKTKCVTDISVVTSSQCKIFRWLVVNQLGSTERRIVELCDKLHLLPWIGLAVPINVQVGSEGRIFCFLPLPADVDCQTGLPVHVHGYFGLTDNRRGLTWPGAECQNNETAEWNELLLTKIGSVVYSEMLEALVTNEPDTGLSPEKHSQLVYSTLPILESVRGHWRCMLEPLFKKLLHQKLFYAHHISRNTWIPLSDGVLDRLRETGTKAETRQAVFKILLGHSQMIITNLPPHVFEIVKTYFSPPRMISPSFVRSILKKSDISQLSREEKLLLLEYVLSDGKKSDLSEVPLLPLANGHFTTFRSHKHSSKPSLSVFVPSGNCTAALLPNMSHRFLDGSIPEAITSKLYSIATTKTKTTHSTQLVRLTDQIVLENIRKSLPPQWLNPTSDKVPWNPGKSNHPPEAWLKATWKWIDVSSQSLAPFRGIPLVPANECLGILSQDSKFIFATNGPWNPLPSPVSTLLTSCGCTVLFSVPNYFRHREMNLYIEPPTPAGVLNVLSRVPSSSLLAQFKQIATPSNCTILRDFMSRLPDTISGPQKKILLQLPLFETLHGACTAVQSKPGVSLKAASPEFRLPSGFLLSKGRVIISPTTSNALKLLNILKVEILNPAEVLIQYLFPDISTSLVYNNQQLTLIMQWILEQMFIFKSQSPLFVEHLKAVPFVVTENGERKRPTELYDPNDPVLVGLLTGETDKFPFGVFAIDSVIPKLKDLGLRTRTTLTAVDLYGFVQRIASRVTDVSIRKVKALVEILSNDPSYLNQQSNRYYTLKTLICPLKWLPSATKRPQNYPDFMPWYNNVAFFSPSEIRSSCKAFLIGSSMPTLGINMNLMLQKELGLMADPPIQSVVNHLKVAIDSWKLREHETTSSMLTAKFQEMLASIYLYLSQFPSSTITVALQHASIREWLWHGDGFCLPKNVALSKDFALDLRPQLFVLQNEFQANSTLRKFFLRHGVRDKFSNEDILGVLAEIRKKHDSCTENNSNMVDQDLEVCCAILKWVVRDGNVLSESLQENVFVPVQSLSNALVLEPCQNCAYYDRDWLRQGGSELDVSDDFKIVHDSVPEKVARLLGVPPLSTCLLSAETLGFEQTGPYESITNRLKTILQEYKEGVGIFKELIQNADDAGASEVQFLVDWRVGPKKKLLSPDMADCQGPALWAYNNAEFSDKDFENINKLAGATKVESLGKIGRFGLGFNAVYHLTDVPSFVSREYFVVFDPNINHLQSHIKDKSRPGLRINLAANPRPLSAFEDQFQPYHDVFDCNTQVRNSGEFYCDGTLFRFPFRTLSGASKSGICQSVYNKEKVHRIVNSLKESSPLLLLFTQHVQQVKLYELKSDSEPSEMKLVLSVSKETPKIFRPSNNSCTIPFIKECSKWWKKKSSSQASGQLDPSRCELVQITAEEMPSDLIGVRQRSVNQQSWLVTSSVGTDSSVSLAAGEGRRGGLLPCAAAAVQLSRVTDQVVGVSPYSGVESAAGEAFCFLPLSISTGLPVHVNGYFAITSNRSGIWERTTSRQGQQIEVRWNECLMEDALSNAYVQLLEDLKSLSKDREIEKYIFHTLWPVYGTLHSLTWGKLAESFYTKLVEEPLPLLYSDGKWLTINDGYILEDLLCGIPEIVETLKRLKKDVFHVPRQVISSFVKAGKEEALKRRTLSLETFLANLFFPNIGTIPQTIRDPIVCRVLDWILSGHEEFAPLFDKYPCITCSEDGNQLARPSELVNPRGPVAVLFSPEENRFPVGDYFLTNNRIHSLEQLGMVKDKISWHEICGRAESVKKIAVKSYGKGQERARFLMKYLTENIEKLMKIEDKNLTILRRTEFLPVVSTPPDGYGLPWKGSESRREFLAPNNLFMSSDKHLIGSCCAIVDDSEETGCGKLGEKVKDLLGFSRRFPSIEQVVQQLDVAIKSCVEGSHGGKIVKRDNCTLERVCNKVYKHFEDLITKSLHENVRQKGGRQLEQAQAAGWLLEKLKDRSWIFIQGRFVSSEKVARNWSGNGFPYLFGLPYEYTRKYDNLFSHAGVRQSFDENDFLNALHKLEDFKGGNPLTSQELKLAVCFILELKDEARLKSHIGKVPLPDTSSLLCRSDELTINLTLWLKDRGGARYVHQDIPPHLALQLGAKSLQNRRLKKYSNTIGSSFGQHEKLTDRLKNILKSYPCDSGILKELVQNADDAGATEIHFIHDQRKLPHECVIQNNAEEVQGPSLCVYNNRPFSDEDLHGIQNLGIGSKVDDPEKTGQYGIGFNAVYHLTDCPSFLSNEDTLCLLDPHCRYAPEATPDSPGERFSQIDEEFKEDFKDLFLGYLGEHFVLKGATMFRLPLRTQDRSKESHISNKYFGTYKMSGLLATFEKEARKMLLFLNHIKKISLSEIDRHGTFKTTHEVVAVLKDGDEEQRRNMSRLMSQYKGRPTNEVPWNEITYPLILSDSKGIDEKWLVHQCCGTKCPSETEVNGHSYGLFPRGGVAALVSSSEQHTSQRQSSYVAYCFLPLPVETSLPVHVNGHFALDSSRRNLWHDTNQDGPLTRWNNFMKSRVLAPGYATLIAEARKYIPFTENHPEDTMKCSFANFADAERGLHWYHTLFPRPSKTSPWNIMACELYRILEARRAPVLPIVVSDKTQRVTSTGSDRQRGSSDSENIPQKIRDWLPVQDSYFIGTHDPQKKAEERLFGVLLRTYLPLLVFSPADLHTSFQEAGVTSNLLNPRAVIDHLKAFRCQNSVCKIGELPSQLKDTNIRSILDLIALVRYCKNDENFPVLLEGLPLLLTADGQLRAFDPRHVVYYSKFSDLFPAQVHSFVHPDFIFELPEVKDLAVPPVMKDFTVCSLVEHLPSVFPPNMKGVIEHIPWTFCENGRPLSKKWFQRLWDFLENYAKPENEEKCVSLSILGEWPIVPTSQGNLVTINNSKTVLDATPRRVETGQGSYVRDVLIKLGCPTLNTEITVKKSANYATGIVGSLWSTFSYWSSKSQSTDVDDDKIHVTNPYVAHPHSVPDTLQVLDHMRKVDLLDVSKMTDQNIHRMLAFFQDDLENLQPREKSMTILRSLPFYKAIDGHHFSLSSFTCYAVIPSGVPTQEIEKLQRYTGCLFLHPDPTVDLNLLYEALGIGVKKSHSEFYTKYIIPSFKIFGRESQVAYLTHVRDSVLPSLLVGKSRLQEREMFLQFLLESPCVPDENGNLHHAREFHDPRNPVFRIMLEEKSNQFPPSPFHEYDWLEFLSLIGLKTDVDEDQFLEFCREVARVANMSRENEGNANKSRVLVQYLMESEHLRSEKFICAVSSIKFIASEKVESWFLSLHRQYRCNTEDEQPPYVQFFNAVPWDCRVLVWTSAELLPCWVQPSIDLIRYFGIQAAPSVETVTTHLQNVSFTLHEISRRDEVLPRPTILTKTMISIYTFLEAEKNCDGRDISDNCSPECKAIGTRLKSTPCVLVENGKVLVKGDQLSFTVQDHRYYPFLYAVPREYGPYQHLLKRLGATEQLTSLQLANVLKAIKSQCQDGKMNPNLTMKACSAMGQLFQCVDKESNSGKKASMISELTELFLPSEDGLLMRSNKLVCRIPPRLKSKVDELEFHTLLPLEKCGLMRDKEDDYLKALPDGLRPMPLDSLFREILDPSCLGDTCPLCQANSPCDFIQRYMLLLQSSEFQQGLVRLLKHQKNSNDLTAKENERSSVFDRSKLAIKCMRHIKVHLIDVSTEKPLKNSSWKRSCYVVEKNGLWTLYIQHDNGERSHSALSLCVNKILGWCISDTRCMLAVSSMLQCDSPSQIPGVLNNLDIAHDFAEETVKIGQQVPAVFHHLMQQNPLFLFHEGEIVAYGIEIVADNMNEEEDREEGIRGGKATSMKYILARVIARSDKPAGDEVSYDFTAQYQIDLGDEEKTVSVLDLYKFYQNDFLENLTRDLVPYTGDPSSKPTSLDEAKREIQEALRAAWRLSDELRRKALRRLYLRWHPDKNPDNAEFATEIMQFLLSEIKRMEAEEASLVGAGNGRGFGGMFTRWDRQARRDRETYQNFRHCHGGHRGSFFRASDFTYPNPRESDRWLRQAHRDLEVAEYLLSALRPFNASVCFVSHQIVEKSLKAALYAKCGLTNEQLHTHDVYRLANDVCRLKKAPDRIINLALVVANYYLPTRYPNRQPGTIIPADAFDKEQSQKAVETAKELLEMLNVFLEK